MSQQTLTEALTDLGVDTKPEVERICNECGKSYPWTKVFFPAKKGHTTALQLVCRRCKKQKKVRLKLQNMEAKAIDAFVVKSTKGGSNNNIPHSAEMLEAYLKYFGGLDGLASACVKQFYDTPPGSRGRQSILEMITKLAVSNTQAGGAKKPVNLYSEEELLDELDGRLKMFVDGKVVDDGHKQNLGLPEGATAGPPSGVALPTNGSLAALSADPGPVGLPQVLGE